MYTDTTSAPTQKNNNKQTKKNKNTPLSQVIERPMASNEAEIFHFMLDHGFTYAREQRGNRLWVNHNYPNPPKPRLACHLI